MSSRQEITESLQASTKRDARSLEVEDAYGIEEAIPTECAISDITTPIDVICLRAIRRDVIAAA